MLSVILPASNEEAWIGPCLDALIASDPIGGPAEILVIANACRDGTVAQAQSRVAAAQVAGWDLQVFDLAEPGKLNALNVGDTHAKGPNRVYLDADVVVSPPLMQQIFQALTKANGAAYASGSAVIPRPASWVTRAYARFWQQLPFARATAPGYGLFAVNAKGRERWDAFPQIISDDTYVRLQFLPQERIGLPATYSWPMVEGFAKLVKVRRRQDDGVKEIAQHWPELLGREGKSPLGPRKLLAMAAADPIGFAIYAAVSLAVKLGPKGQGWVRGR